MFWVFIPLISIGAVLSLVGLVKAVGSWLRLNRARRDFQIEVTDEVSRLAARTSELESGVNGLSQRSSELPFRFEELQRSIRILQVLTGSLAVSLRQAARVLNFSQLKTTSAASLGDAVKSLGKNSRS